MNTPVQLEPLTPREMDVLELLCVGMPNKGVAAKLGISIHTVIKHRMELNRKLGATCAMELLRAALIRGLVTLEVAP